MYKILHTKYSRKIAYKHHNGKSSIGFIFTLGAAMGFVGIFSYLGAAIQENVSASLISNNTIITDGNRIYDFDSAIMFWIGSSIISLLLAASLWNTKVVK